MLQFRQNRRGIMDESKLKEEKNGKLYFLLIALLLFVLLVIGISVVAVTVTKKGDKVNTITTGNISLDYTEDNNGITITSIDYSYQTIFEAYNNGDYVVCQVKNGDAIAELPVISSSTTEGIIQFGDIIYWYDTKEYV